MTARLTYLSRLVVVALATLLFAFAWVGVALVRPSRKPRLLRFYLETLGGGFAKTAQVLAMRYDLLPAPYYQELARTLDRMPPLGLVTVRRIIERELGRSLEQAFSRFDPTPLGSASVAQAHAATLPDGSEVVVKVMRPRIEHRLRSDMLNIRVLAHALEALGVFGGQDLSGLAEEIERLSREEVDFRAEAFNAQLMADHLAADRVDHRAPRPYFPYCTRRMITLERLDGVWVHELIAAVERKDHAQLAAWAERGIHPRRTARLIFRSMLEQTHRHRLFHADPHAGNMIVSDGGTLGYIDFGMVGRVDEREEMLLRRIVESIAGERYHQAYEALLMLLEPLGAKSLAGFESEVKTLYGNYVARVRSPHASVSEKSSGRLYLAVALAVRRAQLRLPIKLARYYRSQLVSDMSVFKLSAELDPVVEISAFLGEQAALRPWAALAQAGQAFLDVPSLVHQLADWVQVRLPAAGRSYGERANRLERGITLTIQYLSRGAALSALMIAADHFLGTRYLGGTIFDRDWAVWIVGLSIVSYCSRRIAQKTGSLD